MASLFTSLCCGRVHVSSNNAKIVEALSLALRNPDSPQFNVEEAEVIGKEDSVEPSFPVRLNQPNQQPQAQGDQPLISPDSSGGSATPNCQAMTSTRSETGHLAKPMRTTQSASANLMQALRSTRSDSKTVGKPDSEVEPNIEPKAELKGEDSPVASKRHGKSIISSASTATSVSEEPADAMASLRWSQVAVPSWKRRAGKPLWEPSAVAGVQTTDSERQRAVNFGEDLAEKASNFEEFTIRVEKTQSQSKIGLSTESLIGQLEGCLVKGISPGGIVDVWNRTNPDLAVSEGDIIVEVNGERTDAEGLWACVAYDDKLNIVFRRLL